MSTTKIFLITKSYSSPYIYSLLHSRDINRGVEARQVLLPDLIRGFSDGNVRPLLH
jgi:hypothetical protein